MKKSFSDHMWAIPNMLLFSAVFMLISLLLPSVYYKYIDTTVYWRVLGDAKTDKREYYKGETPSISFVRESTISHSDSTLTSQLICQNKDYLSVYDEYKKQGVLISRGISQVTADVPIQKLAYDRIEKQIGFKAECYFERMIGFKLNDVYKQYKYKTNRFIIYTVKGGE
jgi:hypothetical protein